MPDLLPENVALADLVADSRLRRPAKYLRLALANMLRAGEFGSIELRIGRMGNGSEPMYVLEQKSKIIDRFGGQVHESWIDDGTHHDENWSQARTTAAELHALWRKVTPDA